uniref:Ig-like domain-containing protein n=1 Tax=Astyanax mexicanus TaxID=7994 RepID=A0A8B9RNH2_ASTMX
MFLFSWSFSVVVPETPVSGLFGGSVTLPCALSDNLDARKLEVRWYRPSMYSSPALLYLNEKLDLTSADLKYQGRVSLPGPLEKGEASLKLDDLRSSDIGTYMCHVSSDSINANIILSFLAVGSSPILSMLDAGGGKVNVSCRSHGWLPKPTLTWRDREGSSLNPPNETHTSTKGSPALRLLLRLSLCYHNNEKSTERKSRVTPHLPTELFSVVVPETTVSGQLGGSVTLPCALSDNLDVRQLEVRWYRPSMYSSPALLYLNEKLDLSVTDITYQGRVSLPGPLEKGDVSLKLDDLRSSDLGMYMCHVSSDRWYDKTVGSSPILSMLDAGGGKVNVSCQSHGWLPKPSLSWRDSDGSILFSPLSVSEGFFSVSSWRLFTSSESSWVSCSVALPDSVGVIRESRVMPHLPTDNGTFRLESVPLI